MTLIFSQHNAIGHHFRHLLLLPLPLLLRDEKGQLFSFTHIA